VRELTEDWSIDVDDSFRGRVVDGDLQLVSLGPPLRTVWITVWAPPPGTVEDVLAGIARSAHPDPVERFEERSSDDAEVRIASWYPEPTADGGAQWGLYAYTVRDGSYVQSAFLTDHEADRDWALKTWRSLTFTPCHRP
jgi:hypothetical protein